MENALIISLKFNYGHLSGLMGWYSMLNSLGYRTSFLMDEQYSGCFDEKNYDVLYRFSPQIGYNLVVFFNISTGDWKLARYFKKHTNAKILFIYHEPWRGLGNEIKRFKHDKKNFIKQVGRMVFAREVIRSSDLVICPSAQAADFYRNHEARYNPHYVAFPLVFQDDCFGGKYRKDKTYFSFISTATLDILPLDVAVYKLDDGFIIIQIQNDHGHGILPSLFAGIFPPVTGDQLIAAFCAGTGNGRDKHTILADTFFQLLHGGIVPHGEGILRMWVKLG